MKIAIETSYSTEFGTPTPVTFDIFEIPEFTTPDSLETLLYGRDEIHEFGNQLFEPIRAEHISPNAKFITNIEFNDHQQLRDHAVNNAECLAAYHGVYGYPQTERDEDLLIALGAHHFLYLTLQVGKIYVNT